VIDFNREQFPSPEEDKTTPQQKLEENLKMQRDCEIEIEKCRDIDDQDALTATQQTLDVLKLEEESIRKLLEE